MTPSRLDRGDSVGGLKSLEVHSKLSVLFPKYWWKIHENNDEYRNIIVSSINISLVSELEGLTVAPRVYGTAH